MTYLSISPIKELYDAARAAGRVDYVCTLLRVEYYSIKVMDPLLCLQAELDELSSGQVKKKPLQIYSSLLEHNEPLNLLANLFNCVRSLPYDSAPFHRLGQMDGMFVREPTLEEKIGELKRMSLAALRPQLRELIAQAYPEALIRACSSSESPEAECLNKALNYCRSLLSALLKIYFDERLSFRGAPRFYKFNDFVIELLVDYEEGLNGFQAHAPNGSVSTFARFSDSVYGRNIMFAPQIEFFVGSLDNWPDEWLVCGRRLHDLGLSGRYNKWGEWKPIVYPVVPSGLLKEARSLAIDSDVQGTLFYILSTGFRGIEFAVCTNADLPSQSGSIGGVLHLWKCLPLNDVPPVDSNLRVYDGWFELDSIDPEEIRDALAMIGIFLSRLAFAFDAEVSWRVKYRRGEGGSALATPNEEDIKFFNSLLVDFPKTEDALVLNQALDWYTRGRSSPHMFTKFLCYYISVESIATAVFEEKADLNFGFKKSSKAIARAERAACIKAKHDEMYATNPEEFVRQAYFDCIYTIRHRTESIIAQVFGTDHEYLNWLFKKGEDGYSLHNIRGRLAHGGFSLSNRGDEEIVAKRLPEISQIAKEFLTRAIFMLNPEDALPTWSRRFSVAQHLADPRSTMFVTRESALPTKDWRIRPHWCR
jgi:hypothetical protein